MNGTSAADVVDYNTSLDAKDLRDDMPIVVDDIYQTIVKHIRDDDGARIIIQTKGDDGATRIHIIDYGTTVDVGTVTQYGIKRPGRQYVMPVHLSHGPLARSMALDSIAQYGGQLMVRQAIPDNTNITGGIGVDDFQPTY